MAYKPFNPSSFKFQGLSKVSIGGGVIERERKPLARKTSGSGRVYVRELKRISL